VWSRFLRRFASIRPRILLGCADEEPTIPLKKTDRASSCGDLLAMSEDERAAFLRAYDGPSPEDWEKNPEEAYWRSFRNSVELIRMLRDVHPTARQLAMTAEEITSYYRRLKPGPRTEEQRQFDLKIVSRERPGKKANPSEKQDDKYLRLMQECINKHSPNMSRARKVHATSRDSKTLRLAKNGPKSLVQVVAGL
jgi:hypothetical protein